MFIEDVTSEHFREIRTLFREYEESLDFELDFQNFTEELASLPGQYAPPRGRLLLAQVKGRAAGCVALRRMDVETCEMKRLYVRPRYRGRGIGRALSLEIIQAAGDLGYARMRLDTIDNMLSALALYRSLGFQQIEPYRFNPIKGAVFMELLLKEPGGSLHPIGREKDLF